MEETEGSDVLTLAAVFVIVICTYICSRIEENKSSF